MQNKYDDMSDFEINDEVVESLGLCPFMYYSYDPYFIIWDVASNDKYNGFVSKKGSEFDPCNDRSVAFQLMIDNEMTLEKNIITDKWIARSRVFNDKNNMVKVVSYVHENPCRAIALCYLMMKDAENAAQSEV